MPAGSRGQPGAGADAAGGAAGAADGCEEAHSRRVRPQLQCRGALKRLRHTSSISHTAGGRQGAGGPLPPPRAPPALHSLRHDWFSPLPPLPSVRCCSVSLSDAPLHPLTAHLQTICYILPRQRDAGSSTRQLGRTGRQGGWCIPFSSPPPTCISLTARAAQPPPTSAARAHAAAPGWPLPPPWWRHPPAAALPAAARQLHRPALPPAPTLRPN